MVTRNRRSMTRAQYPKFFSMLRKAAFNLGLRSDDEIEEYRRTVLREEAGCESVKELDRKAGFDACIKRFAEDAGDYEMAIDIGMGDTRRVAYVVKVMAIQILQLKGWTTAAARQCLEGVIDQARLRGVVMQKTADSYYMDVTANALQSLLQILDSYRRKLLKQHFPHLPVKFDDTVIYEIDGCIHKRYTGIPVGYYDALPFAVNVNGGSVRE